MTDTSTYIEAEEKAYKYEHIIYYKNTKKETIDYYIEIYNEFPYSNLYYSIPVSTTTQQPTLEAYNNVKTILDGLT